VQATSSAICVVVAQADVQAFLGEYPEFAKSLVLSLIAGARGDAAGQECQRYMVSRLGAHKPRVLLSWSSGKDSAWALHVLRQQGEVEVVGLLTTFNAAASRVAMHAVREELLDRQAMPRRLPVWKVPLPWPCSNEEYEALMTGVFERARVEGIDEIAYGDLFLEDIRAYREARHAGTGIGLRFPLWGRATRELAQDMLAGGCARPSRAWTRDSSR
jgi:hypothetical protein